jgi:ribosomal protein L32
MCERGQVANVWTRSGIREVDACLMPLIDALNRSGHYTASSCCGHGLMPGNICLEDGRELVIMPDHAASRELERRMGWRLTSVPQEESSCGPESAQ